MRLCLIFLFVAGLAASAVAVLPRQDSDTNYEGYTLENCDDMLAACKGHLVHPGHVPGGMKQCQFEMSQCLRDFGIGNGTGLMFEQKNARTRWQRRRRQWSQERLTERAVRTEDMGLGVSRRWTRRA
jgi:hypothetical protein